MLIFVTSVRFVLLTIILPSGVEGRAPGADVVLTVAVAAAAAKTTTTTSTIRSGRIVAAVAAVAEAVAEDAGSGERMMLTILSVNMHGFGLIIIGRRRGRKKPLWVEANLIIIILPATIHEAIIVWAMTIAHAAVKMNEHQLKVIGICATVECRFALLAEMLLLAGLYGFDCVPAVKVMGWLVVFPVLLVMPQAMTSTVLY